MRTPHVSGGDDQKIEAAHGIYIRAVKSKVINVGSDTFGNPIFYEGLQNQPFSQIISVLGYFA